MQDARNAIIQLRSAKAPRKVERHGKHPHEGTVPASELLRLPACKGSRPIRIGKDRAPAGVANVKNRAVRRIGCMQKPIGKAAHQVVIVDAGRDQGIHGAEGHAGIVGPCAGGLAMYSARTHGLDGIPPQCAALHELSRHAQGIPNGEPEDGAFCKPRKALRIPKHNIPPASPLFSLIIPCCRSPLQHCAQ